ncbi:MAG: hypothetical protein AAF984_02305 [Verrucomicrobiota bacterium]
MKIDSCEFYKPLKSKWTAETLLSTQSLWDERTIVLLGDVFYTKAAMGTIVHLNANIRFIGRNKKSKYTSTPWKELFAVSFEKDSHLALIESINVAIQDAQSGGKGKLWQIYRSLVGLPLNKIEFDSIIFIHIDDFTDDFDSPSEYDASIKRYEYLTSNNIFKRIWIHLWMLYIDITTTVKNIFGI